MGRSRPFVLRDGMNNLYQPIRNDVVLYFKENKISWWVGDKPSGHTLSSQITCLNHLFAIMNDHDATIKASYLFKKYISNCFANI